MAGKIIADIIEAPYDKITLNVGNTTVLTANGTGITYVPTSNLNINIGSTANLTLGNVTATSIITNGIKFPGTQVASGDANTLDDYEEGTWTATLKGSIADPTTPVTSTARYTKIGDMVSLFIGYDNVNTTGASGNITVIGLPFTNNGVRTVGSINSYSLATFSGGYLSADLESTSTTIFTLNVQSASTWGLATHNAGAGRYMFIAISYTV